MYSKRHRSTRNEFIGVLWSTSNARLDTRLATATTSLRALSSNILTEPTTEKWDFDYNLEKDANGWPTTARLRWKGGLWAYQTRISGSIKGDSKVNTLALTRQESEKWVECLFSSERLQLRARDHRLLATWSYFFSSSLSRVELPWSDIVHVSLLNNAKPFPDCLQHSIVALCSTAQIARVSKNQ